MSLLIREHRKFIFLFLIAVSIRFINIGMPILEGTATRQVQTAMVARDFYRNGFDIMFPEVDHLGPGKTCLILEFPLLNTLAACGYALAGGVHEWIGRLFSVLFFAGGLLFLYLLVKKIFDEDAAFWAAFVYGFSPLSIVFSRAFMPDFEMLFFIIGSLYLMYLYREKGSGRFFWASSVFTMLAVLSKPQAFYVFVPLAYLVFRKEGLRALINPKNWLYPAVAAVPPALWYIRASAVQASLAAQEAYNFELFHWIRLGEFVSIEFYKDLIAIWSGIFLTPIGLTLFILGLFVRAKARDGFLWAWMCGLMIYLVVFASHMDEPYYNLAFLPLAAVFIAKAVVFLKGLDWKGLTYIRSRAAGVILVLLVGAFIARWGLYAYTVPSGYKYIPEAGKAVEALTNKEDLVVASSAGGPAALYYCGRKGWPLQIWGENTPEDAKLAAKLQDMRAQGADVYVCPVMAEFDSNKAFKEYMRKNFKLIAEEKGKYVVFSLKQ